MDCSEGEQQEQWMVQVVRSLHVGQFSPELLLASWLLTRSFCRVLRNVPFVCAAYRLWTAIKLDFGFFTVKKNFLGNWLRRSTTEATRSHMIATASPRYRDILVPNYDFGAKRPVMDHGYLAATNDPNFRLIKCDGLKSVSEDGKVLVDSTGEAHEVDIVILAHGYKSQELLTPMEIFGRNGTELRALWQEKGGARAYMGYVLTLQSP